MTLLNQAEISSRLKTFPGWQFDRNAIVKNFKFKDFGDALRFVNKVGKIAESLNHHPDIFLHSWNNVRISVSTHSEGGVTEKDFMLAKQIDESSLKRSFK